MAKVREVHRTTIQVEVYVGIVKCPNKKCGVPNTLTINDKDPISITCEGCGKEIGCEWD